MGNTNLMAGQPRWDFISSNRNWQGNQQQRGPTISSESEMKICIRFGFSEREFIWNDATQSGEGNQLGKFLLEEGVYRARSI